MQNTKEVRADLRISRRELGLAQKDVAHLLKTTQPRISNLERGISVLTLTETYKLCLVYNKEIEELFFSLRTKIAKDLAKQIRTLEPEGKSKARPKELRLKSLSELHERLANHNHQQYEKE